ncbi:MAG: hypothetical protein ACM30H_13455 [Clostridia bacterium]
MTRIALIVATFVLGLALDTRADLPAQAVIGAATWVVLAWVMRDAGGDLRRTILACVVLATAGEMFLSLVLGLYTYRLGNIPLFIPPGHALLLLLGISLSGKMKDTQAVAIIGIAGAYSLWAAVSGIDTLGVFLFAILAVTSILLPAQRRLYASTFLLALGLELYGTALGSWAWAREPLGLVTTNPPLAAGAFYAALDALTVLATRVTPVAKRLAAASGRA